MCIGIVCQRGVAGVVGWMGEMGFSQWVFHNKQPKRPGSTTPGPGRNNGIFSENAGVLGLGQLSDKACMEPSTQRDPWQ